MGVGATTPPTFVLLVASCCCLFLGGSLAVMSEPQSQPQNATVCVAQILILAGDKDGNIVRIDRAAARCVELGADIAVFPETSLLGWDNPAAWNRSSTLPNGPDAVALGAIARRRNLTMVVGLAERVNATTLYDSAVLLSGSDGSVLGVHRKINVIRHLMTPPYSAGSIDPENVWVVDTPCCGRVGVLICADTFRQDVLQLLASQRPDIVLVPYGWSGCPVDDPDAQAR